MDSIRRASWRMFSASGSRYGHRLHGGRSGWLRRSTQPRRAVELGLVGKKSKMDGTHKGNHDSICDISAWTPHIVLTDGDQQSSRVIDRMRKALVYIRMIRAKVVTSKPRIVVKITKSVRFDGSTKFGDTRGGGTPAGPLRSIRSCA